MARQSHRSDQVEKALYRRHADFCKVLSHPTRLQIIDILHDREMTVTDLASRLGIAVGNLSQHLSLMKQRGVLVSRKAGNSVIYGLANPKMTRACGLIREILLEQIKQDSALFKRLDRSHVFQART